MERKAEPLVALIVGWVARLQIRGCAFGVDARQVLCEERHAEAVPAVRRMRTQETQVVVGLPTNCPGPVDALFDTLTGRLPDPP
jgi:hypothetical protein